MLVAAIRESLIEAGEAGGPGVSAGQLQPCEQGRGTQDGLSNGMAGGAAAVSGSAAPDTTPPLHQVRRLGQTTLLQVASSSVHTCTWGYQCAW